MLGGATIDFATMPHLDDFNGTGGVINRVHDPEFALPNSVPPFDTRKLLGLRWSGLGCQRTDSTYDTLPIFLLAQRVDLVYGRRLDQDLIFGHVA
jgi:hypothetical protein